MSTKKAAKAETVSEKPIAAKPLAKPLTTKPVKPVKAPVIKKVEAKPAAKAVKEIKEVKVAKTAKAAKKPKVVRDSFTMPQSEYQKIALIKETGLKVGLQVKKSEVLRAGVIALCAMSEEQLKAILGGLEKIKTGRPNKH